MTSARGNPLCIQINWQRQLGGGEVYTRFFTQALQSLGWDVHLVVDRTATFWHELNLEGVHFIPIVHGRDIPGALPTTPTVVITHNILPPDTAQWVAERHRLGGIVHMPMAERNPRGLAHYHRIFPVSSYVRDTIRACGHVQVTEEALLGVADLESRTVGVAPVLRRNKYDWDKRKLRERLFSCFDPLRKFVPQAEFMRRPGLTLGIVSRLTPIKQFPALFQHLAPILAEIPDINLEVFGSGGYASVRDLRRALVPIRKRVRFWGHQPNPAVVYPFLDYVISGLPEREALGLNLIEAQVSGTPVIAVAAPPFTETVEDGASGFLYTDPRLDNGEAFDALIRRLAKDGVPPDPHLASDHLAKFSADAFRQRVDRAMAELVS